MRSQMVGNSGNTAEVNSDGSQLMQLTGSNVGYSTDVKPVLTATQKGYSFLELDTKNIYFWDATKWVLF
jgi:exoribonuclease II